MKRVLCFLLILLVNEFVYGNDILERSYRTDDIVCDGVFIRQYNTTYYNDSREAQWIFFETDTAMSNSDLICNRFKRKYSSGMSIFQCLLDDNADWSGFTPDIMSSFVKILQPNESFSIIVLNSDTNDYIKEITRIIPDTEIRNIFRLLPQIVMSPSPIVYKSGVMVIP